MGVVKRVGVDSVLTDAEKWSEGGKEREVDVDVGSVRSTLSCWSDVSEERIRL